MEEHNDSLCFYKALKITISYKEVSLYMNYRLICLAFLFFFLYYLTGVKKYIRWLSGWKQFHIKDKKRFTKLISTYLLVVGSTVLISGFIDYPFESTILYCFTLGYGDLLMVYISNHIIE